MSIFSNLGKTMTVVGHKTLFKLKKASPELLLGGGILLLVGGTVMACKATKKVDDILDDGKKEVDEIKDSITVAEDEDEDVDKLVRKDIAKSKLRTFGRITGAYAPAAAMGVAGIAMIFTSHGIMKHRQGVLLASYNALDAAFRSYRQRVLEDENGAERDRRYLTGGQTEELVEYTEDENGDLVRNVNKEAMMIAGAKAPYGPYTFEFSKYTTRRWAPHADTNLTTIRSAEDWGSTQLRLEGHLFLNDILDYLDMEKVPWGQLVGWIRGGDGDNTVRLMTNDVLAEMEADDDIWKKPIFIEANCDGMIWDKI